MATESKRITSTQRQSRFGHYLLAACSGLIALLLASWPTAAHGAFDDVEYAGQKVSAATLMRPPSLAIACDRTWWFFPRVTVTGFGAVASANYYEIKLTNPSGDTEVVGDITKTSASQPFTHTSSWRNTGSWGYELRAYYKVPSSTNAWSAPALQGTVACN
mgnify:CR=1 FL=1